MFDNLTNDLFTSELFTQDRPYIGAWLAALARTALAHGARDTARARSSRRTTGLGEYSPSSSKPSDGTSLAALVRHWRHSHAAALARGTVARRARGLGEISKVKVRGRSRAPLTFARTDNSQSAQITFKISEIVWT